MSGIYVEKFQLFSDLFNYACIASAYTQQDSNNNNNNAEQHYKLIFKCATRKLFVNQLLIKDATCRQLKDTAWVVEVCAGYLRVAELSDTLEKGRRKGKLYIFFKTEW